MTDKWHEVTATEPCPACEKPDWCAWTPDRKMLKCQRSVDPPAGFRMVKREDGGALFAPIDESGSNGKRHLGTIVKTYDYADERGKVLFQVVRYQPKDFRQRRPDGKGGWTWSLKNVRRVLYRLRELLSAALGTTIYIVEGERDVDTLIKVGLVATCNPGGACKWSKLSDDSALHGHHIVVIADADEPGRKHALDVAQRLHGKVATIKIIEVPKGKDASDFFDAGGTRDDIERLVGQTPIWEPGDDKPDADDDDGEDHDGGREKRESCASVMVALALNAGIILFHSGDNSFAAVPVGGHRETYRIGSKAFRNWLQHLYYTLTTKAPGGQALQDALNMLNAKARFDGPELAVAVRIAEHGGDVYIDLADSAWRVVRVDATGWKVVENPPVRFIRPRGVLSLPVPERGGSLSDLRCLLNIEDDSAWALLLSWLVAAMRPVGPYPVLVLAGEQGSGKTTAARFLRAVFDTNISPVRSSPKEPRDLMISATNSWVVVLDNLSHLPAWLSDCLCRLSTGGGFATRELYSDSEEMIFAAQRPVVLNGITEVATRPDLLDRCITVSLPTIPEDRRRPESDLWATFRAAAPGILGALLDAVAVGLRTLPSVRLDRLPRMADFAMWVTACESGLGLAKGAFMDAYVANRSEANTAALEGCPVGPAILTMMESRTTWAGTFAELLSALETVVSESDRKRHGRAWPTTPRALSSALRRVAPNLRAAGVNVMFGRRTRRGTTIQLEQIGETPSQHTPPSHSTVDGPENAVSRDGRVTVGDGQGFNRHTYRHTENALFGHENAVGDGGDGGDGEIPPCSDDDDSAVDNAFADAEAAGQTEGWEYA